MSVNRPHPPTHPRHRCRGRAFTLVEMIIVLVILAILAAIVTSRMSGASQRAGAAALDGDLATLRKAIEMYQVEHAGQYPSAAGINQQLTQFTDHSGDPSPDKDATHSYGPYLRSVPPLSVGTRRGRSGIAAANGGSVGWIYDATTGHIRANSAPDEADDQGKLYLDY